MNARRALNSAFIYWSAMRGSPHRSGRLTLERYKSHWFFLYHHLASNSRFAITIPASRPVAALARLKAFCAKNPWGDFAYHLRPVHHWFPVEDRNRLGLFQIR